MSIVSTVLLPRIRTWKCDNSPGEAIVLESTLLSLKRPSPRTLEAYRHVFNNVSPGKSSFPTLGGHGSAILDDRNDLMALKLPQEDDRLTRLLRHCCPVFFAVSLLSPSTSELISLTASSEYHKESEVM